MPRWIATPRRRRFNADFVGADEVLGFFLELHVGVADEPERALAADTESRKQPIKEQRDDIVEQDEVDWIAGCPRKPDETLHLAGQRNQCAHGLPVLLAQEQQGDHKAHVGNERERMRRIDRQGREDREHAFHEPGVEPLDVLGGQFVGLADLDACLAQLGA